MKQYVVHRDIGNPLRFQGTLLCFVEDAKFIFILYETLGKQYVCEKISIPSGKSTHEKRKALVCKTREKIKTFFGQSQLAGDLYKAVDIENLAQTEDFEDIA